MRGAVQNTLHYITICLRWPK